MKAAEIAAASVTVLLLLGILVSKLPHFGHEWPDLAGLADSLDCVFLRSPQKGARAIRAPTAPTTKPSTVQMTMCMVSFSSEKISAQVRGTPVAKNSKISTAACTVPRGADFDRLLSYSCQMAMPSASGRRRAKENCATTTITVADRTTKSWTSETLRIVRSAFGSGSVLTFWQVLHTAAPSLLVV